MSNTWLKNTLTAAALSATVGLSSLPASANDLKSQIDLTHAETRNSVMSLMEECDWSNGWALDWKISWRENRCKIKRGIRLKKEWISEMEQQIVMENKKQEQMRQQIATDKQQIASDKQQIALDKQQIALDKQQIALDKLEIEKIKDQLRSKLSK